MHIIPNPNAVEWNSHGGVSDKIILHKLAINDILGSQKFERISLEPYKKDLPDRYQSFDLILIQENSQHIVAEDTQEEFLKDRKLNVMSFITLSISHYGNAILISENTLKELFL